MFIISLEIICLFCPNHIPSFLSLPVSLYFRPQIRCPNMDSEHSHNNHLGKTRHSDKAAYEDSVVLMDCTPFWKKFGITWPQCARIWFVKDICGIICAIFTWLLLLYAEYVIFFVMLFPAPDQIHSIINGVIFQFFTSLAIASHLKAMLTDPVSCNVCNTLICLSGFACSCDKKDSPRLRFHD